MKSAMFARRAASSISDGGAGLAVGDVLADGAVKEVHVLLHKADGAAQRGLRHLADVLPVDGDGAARHVVEARQQAAGRRLAAAGGANEGEGLAGTDAKAQVVDHGTLARLAVLGKLDVVVGEADIVVLDGAGAGHEIRGAGGIVHVGHGSQDLVHAAEARDRLLVHLGGVHEGLDRRTEQRDVQREGGHVHGRELAMRDKPSTHDGDDGVQRARHQAIDAVVAAHRLVHVLLGVEVALVGGAKLRGLGGLVGKRLDHADTLERVLELGVDAADLLAVVREGRAHGQVHAEHHRGEGEGDDEDRGGERRRQPKENDEGADDLDGADDDPLGHVVGGLADVKEVVDHAAHHIAGGMRVEVGKPHALVLVKEVLAHLGLHAGAHDVALRAHEVATAAAHEVHGYEAGRQRRQRGEDGRRALGKQAACERAEDHGKRQVNAGDDHGAHRVRDKQAHHRLVIGEKTLEHGFLSFQVLLRRSAQPARDAELAARQVG